MSILSFTALERRIKLILVFSLLVFFFSCSTLSSSYTYNDSRTGRSKEPTSSPSTKDTSTKTEEEESMEEKVNEEMVLEEIETKKPEKVESTRGKIVGYANTYIGTPYLYAGKTPKGFDCSGFTGYVMKEYDVKLPANSEMQSKEGRKIKLKKARAGDLVFFKKSSVGKVFHVAMVVDNSKDGVKIIHSTSRGVVVDNLSKSDYWRPKIYTVRDVIDLD